MGEEGEFLLMPYSKLRGMCSLVHMYIHPNWCPLILIAANLQLHYCDWSTFNEFAGVLPFNLV